MISNQDIKLPSRKIIIFSLMIVFGYSISITRSINPTEAIQLPLQISFIMFAQLPILSTVIRNKKDILFHAVALNRSLWVINIAMIFYFIRIGIPYDRYRYSLFYNDPNILAVIVSLLVCVSLYYAYYLFESMYNRQTMLRFLFAILSILLGIVTLILTLSRTGMLALLVVILIFIATKFGKASDVNTVISRLAFSIFASIIMGALLAVTGNVPQGILLRVNETIQEGGLEDRIDPLISAARALPDYWLIGAGYNQFTHHVVDYTSYLGHVSKPHNLFVIPLVEGGIFSGIGVIGIFGILLLRSIRFFNSQDNDGFVIYFGFITSAITFTIVMQFQTLWIHRFYWLFISLALVIVSKNVYE